MRGAGEPLWAASQPLNRAAPPRANKGRGPRERRPGWPRVCSGGASPRLPQLAGGREVLLPTLAKVRGLQRLSIRETLQFVYNCRVPGKSCSLWKWQQVRHPTPEPSALNSLPGTGCLPFGNWSVTLSPESPGCVTKQGKLYVSRDTFLQS